MRRLGSSFTFNSRKLRFEIEVLLSAFCFRSYLWVFQVLRVEKFRLKNARRLRIPQR